jgi:hypothetical protein
MQVLLWLKQWDSLVFGSHVRTTSDDVLSALRMHSSVPQSSKFSGNRNFFPKHHGDVPSNDQNVRSPFETRKSNSTHSSWSNKCLVDKPPEHKVGDNKIIASYLSSFLFPKECNFSTLQLSLAAMLDIGLTSILSGVMSELD